MSTVGSHTWSHRNLRSMAPALAKGELELGHSAGAAALGHPIAPFFAFPYLSNSRAMVAHAKSRNLAMWSIDVDAVDYRCATSTSPATSWLVSNRTARASFCSTTCSPTTAGALKGLLDELKAKGYKVVAYGAEGESQDAAQYDAITARELASRGAVAASKPLAPRALRLRLRRRPPSSHQPRPVRSATPPPATPRPPASAATDPTQPSAAPRHPRALGRAEETEPWQLRIFRN